MFNVVSYMKNPIFTYVIYLYIYVCVCVCVLVCDMLCMHVYIYVHIVYLLCDASSSYVQISGPSAVLTGRAAEKQVRSNLREC